MRRKHPNGSVIARTPHRRKPTASMDRFVVKRRVVQHRDRDNRVVLAYAQWCIWDRLDGVWVKGGIASEIKPIAKALSKEYRNKLAS